MSGPYDISAHDLNDMDQLQAAIAKIRGLQQSRQHAYVKRAATLAAIAHLSDVLRKGVADEQAKECQLQLIELLVCCLKDVLEDCLRIGCINELLSSLNIDMNVVDLTTQHDEPQVQLAVRVAHLLSSPQNRQDFEKLVHREYFTTGDRDLAGYSILGLMLLVPGAIMLGAGLAIGFAAAFTGIGGVIILGIAAYAIKNAITAYLENSAQEARFNRLLEVKITPVKPINDSATAADAEASNAVEQTITPGRAGAAEAAKACEAPRHQSDLEAQAGDKSSPGGASRRLGRSNSKSD